MPEDSIRQLYYILKYHQKCFQTLGTKSDGQKNMLQKGLTK